jgi:hypothetical protein
LHQIRRPVFLHSGWRTAGTWLWSQFRRHEAALGLYEPLNESLATMTLRTLPLMRPAASDSRHPETDRPYFEEYAPLLSAKRSGVAGYRPEFAYDTFFMEASESAPALRAYIESLLELGRESGATPVLKFCRSLARLGWMRANFPEAAHILVVREPQSQWLSAWRLSREDDNPHFLLQPIKTLMQHRAHRTVACALEALHIGPEDFMLPEKHSACRAAVRATPPDALYRGFLAFWLVTAYAAVSEADRIIESEKLSARDYRIETERAMRTHTGFTIDLGKARRLDRPIERSDFFDAQHAHRDAIAALDRLEGLGAPRPGTADFLRDKLLQAPAVPIAI